MTLFSWTPSVLKDCFGWPCLKCEHAGHTAQIWRSSPHTTSEEWIYRIDDRPLVIVRGNRGTAKTAAAAALRRVVRQL